MRYLVVREGDSLAHAQHAGYYSPNNGSGNDYKRDRYLFQGVFRVENHGDAEIDLINSRDNSQARTKVPGRIIESGKTAIVNYLVRKSNSRASIDAGQAKLAADAIERYVQQHFNTELHHSDDDDDVIETDDYLEHAQHGFYLGFDKNASVEYTFYYMSDTADANRGVIVELAPKNRIDAITVNTSNHMSVSISPFDFGRARNIQAMKNIFLSLFNTRKRERGLPNIFVTDSEASKIAAKLWIVKTDTMGLNLKEKPNRTRESKSVAGQHTGYYSPNLRHSYTVIPADDELYHHGILGQKWGVRRYQNADGSLTSAGKTRYGKGSESQEENQSLLLALGIVFGPQILMYASIAAAGAAGAIKDKSREKKAEKELFGEGKDYGLTPDDIKKVNPKYGQKGYTNNCPKCSTVVELRKRGMNVTAKSGSGQTDDEMASWFKGAKPIKNLHVDSAEKQLREFPAGSSGFISGKWPGGMGGHVVHWTNIGDGQIRIEDGQVGKVYNWDQFKKDYQFKEDRYCITRLDQCKINETLMESSGVYTEYEEDKKK